MWKLVGAFVIVGTFIAAGWVLEDRYAKADDTKQNRIEIRINSLKDDIRWYQDQMSYIMNRCNVRDPNKLPQHAHKNYYDYKLKKEDLDKELKIMMQKRGKF
jgi:hypothetical protein